MIRRTLALIAVAACTGDDSTATPDASSDQLTLETCTTTIASDVPEPYRSLFRCVEISISGTDLLISITSLPPHESHYWGTASPNYEEFDTRGGAYQPNPNLLRETPVTIAIPLSPVSRNLTISDTMIDGFANTNGGEYRGGPVGVAFDSVALFNAVAAPGDNIDDEQFTFDRYNAHPAPNGQYHYHRDSPGPLEALASLGQTIEGYGLMCDGTLVLGCTELDGSTPVQTDLDAQNGHTHDVITLAARYHVHICTAWTAHPRPYTPEIQFYDRCDIR